MTLDGPLYADLLLRNRSLTDIRCARLVLGWVTAFVHVNHLGLEQRN